MHGWAYEGGRRGAVVAVVLLAGGVCGWYGCQRPAPQPVAYDGPTLAARDLGLTQAPAAADGCELLTDARTQGLFPGAVAVARLQPPVRAWATAQGEPTAGQTWHMGDIAWEEAMGWNALADNVPDIREVIVLDASATVVPTCDLEAIGDAALRREASVCVVYGPSPAKSGHAGLWGVIVETRTGRRLACVQAQAGPGDFSAPETDRARHDLRHLDPNYLVVCKFRRQVRDGLLKLQSRDDRPTATQPNPWHDGSRPTPPIYIIPGQTMDR